MLVLLTGNAKRKLTDCEQHIYVRCGFACYSEVTWNEIFAFSLEVRFGIIWPPMLVSSLSRMFLLLAVACDTKRTCLPDERYTAIQKSVNSCSLFSISTKKTIYVSRFETVSKSSDLFNGPSWFRLPQRLGTGGLRAWNRYPIVLRSGWCCAIFPDRVCTHHTVVCSVSEHR